VQGNSKRDKNITMEIIKGIEGTPNLSNYAQTMEVGTVHGKSILRGRVVSERNKKEIMALAEKVAGAGNVTFLLEVRAKSHRERSIDSPSVTH
ncbi:MAG: BON domain-containing protein, partial [Chthoniobacterales bacterium]